MKINPKQEGHHTWNLTVHYHKCPECGYIIESREDYFYRLGKYIKNVECDRCKHAFTLQKRVKPKVGPLFGEGDTVEMEWGD
ncbi:MAG: hypothetical protein VX777_02385 [Chlamydiota bacterium]|nr:hypothetical protein [Chlamydiota bacterium]